MTLPDLIHAALADGMNPKRLYIASGLDSITFGDYYSENLFSSQQIQDIRAEIKSWREGK